MKKYQRFPGKNHFCLGGRIIQGPDFTQIFYTISLIVVPSILYSIFVIPHLTREVSIAFPILFYPLLLFSLCSLFATSFTDPGILPRDLDHRNEDPNAQPLDANGLPPNYPFGELKPLVYETYNVNGVEVKNKYCATCKLARPPRSTHCGICDNCVERFDHHCPWVGTCVGKRNHRFFTLFGISTALLIGLALASCILHLYLLTTTLPPSDSNKSPFVQALAKAPVSAGLAIFTFFLIWSLGGLSAVHVHFSIVNMTTNEQIKNALQKNPYSRGYFTNFIYFFFGPISPSWIDRQGEILELECHDV